jgi:HPt (histidine-containing phosphotransfer) domain-containing protein
MTANVMANDMETYRRIGMNDCIGKPFKSQELWYYLLKHLKPVSVENNEIETSLEDDDEFRKNIKIMFVKNNSEKFKEITEALNNNDTELAYRLAHTLKSNAGHIGKTFLQQIAGNVEFHLKNGKNMVSGELLGILEKEINNVLSELSELVDDSEAVTSETQIPFIKQEKALELLKKLKPMIEMFNPECLKFTNDLRGVDGSDLLIKQLEDYEFEAALSTLEELMQK